MVYHIPRKLRRPLKNGWKSVSLLKWPFFKGHVFFLGCVSLGTRVDGENLAKDLGSRKPNIFHNPATVHFQYLLGPAAY